jgi:hypothetical protein
MVEAIVILRASAAVMARLICFLEFRGRVCSEERNKLEKEEAYILQIDPSISIVNMHGAVGVAVQT